MFTKVTNGQPQTYTIGQLHRDNPNISFPKDIPLGTLASFNVYPVTTTSAPAIDSKTHRHSQSIVEVDGVWTQTWSTVELPLAQAEDNVRAYRKNLLSETDYLALSDNTMSAAMTTYRQALRDITDQAGFPYSVTWPTKP